MEWVREKERRGGGWLMTSRLENSKLTYLQKTTVGGPHQENTKKMEIGPKRKKLSAMSLTHVEILRK